MLRVVPRVYFFGLIKFDFVGKAKPEVKWKTRLQVGINSRNQSRNQFQESKSESIPGIKSRNQSRFLSSFLKMESPQTQLIEYCTLYPEIREALNDIRDFRLQTTRTMSKEFISDLEEEVGFSFASKSLTQKRNELTNFVQSHPELMNNDIEQLIFNLAFYLNQDNQTQRVVEKHRIKNQRRRIKDQVQKLKAKKEESSDSTIDSESEDKPKK